MSFYGNAAIKLSTGFNVVDILINGSPTFGTLTLPNMNAGAVVGPITTVTSPANCGQHTPITLGGPDAALFAITNGGLLPCNLIVGASNIGGTYHILLTVS